MRHFGKGSLGWAFRKVNDAGAPVMDARGRTLRTTEDIISRVSETQINNIRGGNSISPNGRTGDPRTRLAARRHIRVRRSYIRFPLAAFKNLRPILQIAAEQRARADKRFVIDRSRQGESGAASRTELLHHLARRERSEGLGRRRD